MELLSAQMNFDAGADEMPVTMIEEARLASRTIVDPDEARSIFARFAPALQRYRANQTFTLACGVLVEKQRGAEGMLEFWADLRRLFPDDVTALRMMMRWYRRERHVLQGVEKLHQIYPFCLHELEQAEKAIVGFAELRAFDEIDAMMSQILAVNPQARAIRMRYIKVLNTQSRFLEAKEIADQVQDAHKMGPLSQALLDTVSRRATKMAQLYTTEATDVFLRIAEQLPAIEAAGDINGFGAITFFTGQLGTGGAERQLTRIASAFQHRFQTGQLAGGAALTAPVEVCVKHATVESGADFFLPILRRARVPTTVLTDVKDVRLSALRHVPAEILNLLELMPEDIFEQTCKLIPYFQQRNTQVAYLWQDGGVLSAGMAALVAGVPRIITSFRGLPPNQRPHRHRPELMPLYKVMAALPRVSLSANAQSTATAYEEWLALKSGAISVIPNAIPAVLPDGDDKDEAFWSDVVHRSPDCRQTVVGVFRFDNNKRPLVWVKAAEALAQKNNNVRFVIVGSGYQFAETLALIEDLGLQERVFLAGLRENVGFFLHKADLMLHLAKMEGLPNALIEAQLAGVPVLATPAGGTAEVVTDRVTGSLLPSAETVDPADVAAAMAKMLGQPAELGRMGAAAEAQAKPRFLLDHVVDQTAQLFAKSRKDT